jgi:probable rRNA maturation factor
VREARAQGKTLEAHYAHLVVHAMLHLRGYLHDRARDAKRMERREIAILARLGYADPYAAPIPA